MVRKLTGPALASFALTSSLLLGCGSTVPFKSQDKAIQTDKAPAADASADVTKTFTSGKVLPVALSLDSGFTNLTQTLTLQQNPRQQELYHQIDRAQFVDAFQQGNKGIDTTQTFSVAEAGIFDLLILIDNSSSMGPYQNRLSKTLPDILRYITNTNWRIAVATTSTSCLQKTTRGQSFLSRADMDADPVQADLDFKKMITVGENGNPVERGIYMSTMAMEETGCDAGNVAWLRPASQRAVLLLSDENNCGSAPNEGCAGEPYESANYFFDHVGTDVTYNALLLTQEPPAANPADPTDPNHDCENSGGYDQAPNPASYLTLVNTTGGRYADICRSNYSTVLDQISQDIGKKINAQFELQFAAEASSLEIKVDGRRITNYNVSGKILTVLDPLTEKNGILEVHYKHDPVAMVKTWAPQHPIDITTLEVYVADQLLPSTAYAYNSSTGMVELKDMPAELAQIKFRYRDAVILPRTFTYTQSSYADTVAVSVDGKATKDFGVDKATRTVTLTNAPADGKSVLISYELPGDRHIDYPILGVLNDDIESYVVVDPATGQELKTTIQPGIIEVDPADVSDGRKVEARYNLKHDYQDKIFELAAPKAPFPGSLQIAANGDTAVCSNDVKIGDGKISFRCSDEDFLTIDVKYAYADDYHNSFDIGVDFSGAKSYRVFVNGAETKDYQIFGNQLVILKKNLPAAAEVKVMIHPIASS